VSSIQGLYNGEDKDEGEDTSDDKGEDMDEDIDWIEDRTVAYSWQIPLCHPLHGVYIIFI